MRRSAIIVIFAPAILKQATAGTFRTSRCLLCRFQFRKAVATFQLFGVMLSYGTPPFPGLHSLHSDAYILSKDCLRESGIVPNGLDLRRIIGGNKLHRQFTDIRLQSATLKGYSFFQSRFVQKHS